MTPLRIPGARRAPVLAFAFALALGCGDGTGPKPTPSVRVAVSPTNGGPQWVPSGTGLLVVNCDLDVVATFSGGRQARWGDARFVFHMGANATSVVDTLTVSGDEIAMAYGGPTLAAGDTAASLWTFRAEVPFDLALDFAYTVDAEAAPRRASANASCRPSGAAPNPSAAPPAITDFVVRGEPGANGVLEPGDTVEMRLDATGDAGLLRFVLSLGGACDTTVQLSVPGERTASRTVRLPLPRGCVLGEPVAGVATVYDVALASASREAAVAEALRDATPPTVAPTFNTTAQSWQSTLRGTLFEGDPLYILPGARDNYDVRWLFWEILPAGLRDSVLVPAGTPVPGQVLVQLTRAHVAADVRVRVWARDASGLESTAFETTGGLQVAPVFVPQTRSTTVPTAIRDLAVSSRRGVAYLLDASGRRISLLDLATAGVTGHLELPGAPIAFDVTPSGDSLVVLLSEPAPALAVVDLGAAGAAATVIPLAVTISTSWYPWSVRVAANGRALVGVGLQSATPGTGNTGAVHEVDLRAGTQRRRADFAEVPWSTTPTLERSRDGSSMLLTLPQSAAFHYDVATDAFGDQSPRGQLQVPDRGAVTNGGARVAFGGLLFTRDWTRVSQWSQGGGMPAFSPDESTLLFPVSSTVFPGIPHRLARSSMADGRVIDAWRVGFDPTRVRVADDGTVVLVGFSPTCQPPSCSLVEIVRAP